VVERDEGLERGLAVPTREQDQQLALGTERGLGDLALKGLQIEADAGGQLGATAESRLYFDHSSASPDPLVDLSLLFRSSDVERASSCTAEGVRVRDE
jgi:hypothetical protein